MTTWNFPEFDHTSNTWYVREVDAQTYRTVNTFDFASEPEALDFYIEQDVREQERKGLL